MIHFISFYVVSHKKGEMALEKWLFSIFVYFMYASPETKRVLYKRKLSLKK